MVGVPATTAMAATNQLSTPQLLLEVTSGSGYDFRLIDQRPGSSGQVLLDQSSTVFKIDGSDRNVTGASNVQTGTDWLSANLTLSGGKSATVKFTFTQTDQLKVELTPTGGGTKTKVTEKFADGAGYYYGAWESSKWGGGLINNAGATGGLQDGQEVGTRAPFYFTSKNVGVYAPTVASYNFKFPAASGGTTEMIVDQGSLTYHVMVGDSPKAVLGQYNQIAGPAYMPPDWAFGCMFWKDNPPPRPLDNAQQLRNARIPATVFWLDRPWTDENTGWGWGGQNLDPKFIIGSDNDVTLKEMSDAFAGYGMKLMAWTANLNGGYLSTQPGYELRADDADRPALDVRNAQAYAFFKDYLESFVADGLAGYKIDRGDQGEYKTPNNKGTDVANEVATLFHKLSYESLPDLPNGNKDGFVFARFAHDTARQYTALWNSDAKPSETGLKMSMQHALRAGLINFPMWGSDTGGYALAGGHKQNLTLRWLGLSAYGPFFETESEPGSDPNTDFAKAFRAFTTIHHQLIPYNRSAMRQAILTGAPIMRAMFLEFPSDAALVDKWDQYFLGDSLLVAPIVEDDQVSRAVYLPALARGRWVNYNNPLQRFDAVTAQTVNSTADFVNGVIPVFVREGAIVVRGDVLQANNNWTPNWGPWMNIQVFLGGGVDNQFTYFTGDLDRLITLVQDSMLAELQFGDLGIDGNVQFFLDEALAQGLQDGMLHIYRGGIQLGPGDYTFTFSSRLLTLGYEGEGVTRLLIASAVPEPASALLLMAGAGLLLASARGGGRMVVKPPGGVAGRRS